MSNLRKTLAIVLAITMIATCFIAIPVFAAGTASVTLVPSKTTVAPGETFTIDVIYTIDGKDGAFGVAAAGSEYAVDTTIFSSILRNEATLDAWYDGTGPGPDKNKLVTGATNVTITPNEAVARFDLTVSPTTTATSYTFTPIVASMLDTSRNGGESYTVTANTLTIEIGNEPPATEPPATEPPATQAPATQAPATQAPATQAPATQAPATQAPATEAPTAAPTEAPVVTQPPVDSTEFTIVIDGSNIPADVDKLIVRTDADGDDSDYYVLTRGADNNFTATLPKGYTYSVTGIKDKDDNDLPLDVVNSKLTFDESTDKVVVVEKTEADAFTVALKDDVKVSAAADADALALVPEFTITVTTPVQDGEPTVEDVVYSDATKADFDLRLVDDHNIMVIYKGVAADKYIKVERTIDEFGVSLSNPKPNQVLPNAEKTVPGHYTVTTTWYLVDGDNAIAVSDPAYKADYRTTYRAEIAIKLDHSLDVADSDAKYYLNGKEIAAPGPDGTIIYDYTTPGKSSGGIGGGGFSTSGSTTPTAAPEGTAGPVVAPTAAPVGSQVFEDVPPTYWAYDYIMDLYNAGIINGETATLFMPENNITRAEFTKIAVSVFGLTATSTTSQFVDVQASDWFAPFVIAATEAGLVNGISANEFAPNADITREQMATIIGRQMNMTSSKVMTYSDAASISDYAKEYVAGLTENSLLQGDETGNFRPQANAARSEAATLLDRVYVLTRSEEVPEDVPETTEAPEAATAAPTAAPANNNGGFSTGTEATATPEATAAATAEPEASAAPEATETPASK